VGVNDFLQDYTIRMKESVALLPLAQGSPAQLDDEDEDIGTIMLSLCADQEDSVPQSLLTATISSDLQSGVLLEVQMGPRDGHGRNTIESFMYPFVTD
jgi:hypothetical protein